MVTGAKATKAPAEISPTTSPANCCSQPCPYRQPLEVEARRHVVGVALDHHRLALALRAPHAQLGELAATRRRLPPADRREQRTMADEVRIATDRRGEVAVALRVKPRVAEVARGVVGLLERAQHERVQRPAPLAAPGLDVSLDALGDRSEQIGRLRRRHVPGQRRRGHLERGQLCHETLDPRRLGALVHAIQAWHLLPLQQVRDGFVGGDHQMLDQPVRLGLRARMYLGDVAALVEDELGLLGVDRQRAALLACPSERRGSFTRRLERLPPRRPMPAPRRRRCGRPARSPGARPSGSPIGRRRRPRHRHRRARARR